MTAPILVTKLYIPPTRTKIVKRPELIEYLNNCLDRKLTLISAPAGFGKTTLMSHWLEQPGESNTDHKFRFCWLSLDDEDNDPVRFLTYFITSLNRIKNIDYRLGQNALGMLKSPQHPPIDTILTSLINDVAEISGKIVFVLDDFHLIQMKTIHQALTFLLENLPPQLHLVIATRQDPPLSLGLLRARNQLAELRASDLRFTTSEAAGFLNEVMGLNLSSEDIDELETRTEGWIAGLQLAALSMRGHEDRSGFIKTFTGSHRMVLDFLIEEVLGQQPENIQNFLLQTSILTRLTGSLCDALTDQDNGRETLETLDRSNLFIVPLDEERNWYRYHHLFVDLLRQRLNKTQSDLVPELHRKASKWYEQNKLKVESVDHAIAAGDLARAGYLVEELAEVLWERGEHEKLIGWLDRLSEEQLSTMPQIGTYHAWILHTKGQEKSAEKVLQNVERVLYSIPNDDPHEELTRFVLVNATQLKSRISVIRARIAFREGDIPNIIKFSRKALELLPENDLAWRGMAAMALGDSYVVSGEMTHAKNAYLEAIRISKNSGNVYSILFPSCKLGIILEYLGKLHQAQEHYSELMTFVNKRGLSNSVMTGLLYALWSEIKCHWNEIDTAFQYVSRGVQLSEHESDVANLAWIHNAFVKILFAKRDLIKAKETILRLEKIYRKSHVPPWIVTRTAAWKARIWLTEGNLDAAQQWIQERRLNLDDELQFAREPEYIALARVLVSFDDLESAITLLDRLIEKAEANDRITSLIEMLLILALALKAQGEIDKAITTLERALNLAKPEDFIRVFVDEGPPMASLLYKALSREIAPEFVQRLLAVFPGTEPEEAASKRLHLDQSVLIDPLSDRETEVMQLIAKGLTNQEISNKLFLSIHTIKTHTRNIYSKLDAHHRAEAIAKARSFGII